MSYTIDLQPFGELTEYVLQNTQTGEKCGILPQYGAILRQLNLSQDGQLHDLIFSPSTYYDLLEKDFRASALMFPFPNRTDNGAYAFEGKSYQFPINEPARGNAIHGFVHPKAFEVLEQSTSDTEATLVLRYIYDGHLAYYPFPFELKVSYSLTQNGLLFDYEAKNTSQTAMPVAFGWHPYFKINHTLVDDLQLMIPSDTIVVLNERMIPTGKQPFEEQGFISLKSRVFDNVFELNTTQTSVETILYDAEKNLRLRVWQETGVNLFNYLVVYTPVSRTCVAIEPQTANINALNSGEGLTILAPNEAMQGKVRLMLG
jgi:aldose 1-epimerase